MTMIMDNSDGDTTATPLSTETGVINSLFDTSSRVMDLLQVVESSPPLLAREDAATSMTDNLQQNLANIEHQMTSIRCKLEKKSPKLTMFQLNQKLERIITILKKNGFTE